MDFGIFFFIVVIAIWISVVNSRKKNNRRRLASPSFSRHASPQTPQPLTVVGIADRDAAINAVMAVTGATREDTLTRLDALPTTIWVPAPDVAAALDVFAESGIAYATGSLGEEIRSSLGGPTAPTAGQPALPEPPTSWDTSPQASQNPIEPPSLPEPAPRVARKTPSKPQADSRPAPSTATTHSEATTAERVSRPTETAATAPMNLTESSQKLAEPAWAAVDVTSLAPETAAALASADRSTIERNLRRLSMNGSTEADVALGSKLAEWGRLSEAEGLFRSRAHDHPSASNNLGVIDEKEGRVEAARRSYEQAARLGSREASANLARLREEQ